MSLTKRLSKILSLAPVCDVLADVGCDHGKLGVAAIECKKAQKVIFTDISAPSLAKARELAKRRGVEDRCEFFCGSGLCGKTADCAVVAGMGGKEILAILSKATELPQSLVLNPMRGAPQLRQALQKDYFFEYDQKFFDGKYYDLMLLKRGGDLLDEKQIKYGKTNLADFCQDFNNYLLSEKQKCDIILNKAFSQSVKDRREEIVSLLKGL